jgi:hypothetical protein
MAPCERLFEKASEQRKLLDAPFKLNPKCHSLASIDVFIDAKRHEVVLCCSVCDRLVDRCRIIKKRKKKQ